MNGELERVRVGGWSHTRVPAIRATQPATDAILTAKNNEDLAALLTLGDYCDASIGRVAKEYAGRTIAFDGSVVNLAKYKRLRHASRARGQGSEHERLDRLSSTPTSTTTTLT